MKLTKPQVKALNVLIRQPGDVSAYQARLTMNTLHALEARKLVSAERGVGSFFSPSTATKWRITEAGRQALKGGE